MSQPLAFARNPYGYAPVRRAQSVRRTSSIDMTWPDGRMDEMHMLGRARDIYTHEEGGQPIVLAEDAFKARIGATRVINDIEVSPPRKHIGKLVGQRGGGHLRAVLDEALHEERTNATPLYLLLDDISGASLVGGWAWSRWTQRWGAGADGPDTPPPSIPPIPTILPSPSIDMTAVSVANPNAPQFTPRSMENTCTGFRANATSLRSDGVASPHQSATPVGLMSNPNDPAGWHEVLHTKDVSMRRARRIDIWIEDDVIEIEGAFQDSATSPSGTRIAVHEYGLRAAADLETGKLISISADPRILPYADCPAAVLNVGRLIGASMRDLRRTVLEMLRKTAGCTHLNDTVRSLAEVPILAQRLIEQRAKVETAA